jgi:PqqD family protein of HPr-rel-A system
MSLWRRTPGGALSWRRWGDEAVVYDPNTGDTHLLDALAAEILGRLEAGATGADELAVALARDLDLAHRADITESVTQAFDRFAALGLIEPAATP